MKSSSSRRCRRRLSLRPVCKWIDRQDLQYGAGKVDRQTQTAVLPLQYGVFAERRYASVVH